MKIIIAGHPEMDFLGATITIGAYECGHDVYEIPYIKHLHGFADDDYTLNDGSRGFTGPPGFISDNPLPSNQKSEEEVLDATKDADLIICHSTRRYALEALDKIVARLGKVPNNLVMADGEDSPHISQELIDKYHPIVFMKRELYSENPIEKYSRHYGVPVWPLQFGSPVRSMPKGIDDTEKEWDFVLTMGNTHPLRLCLLEVCLRANIPNSYIGGDHNNPLRGKYPQMKNMLGWQEYMTTIAHAKITANCRGYGRDTLNFFERYCWNTAMLYCPPKLHMPHSPKDGEHCLYFDESCEKIPDLFSRLLNDDDCRKQIAKAGKAHCFRYHTTQKRFEYLTEIAMKIIGGEKIELEKYGL